MEDQEKFISCLKSIRDYWLTQTDKTTEEVVDGVLFSILVMIDGDSSVNECHRLRITDTTTNRQIDCGYLHELYSQR